MKEYKFRAKAIEDFDTQLDGVLKGEWVEGYYYWSQSNLCGIIVTELMEESGGVGSGIMECHIQVDYKTVSQYTCLKDRNGKEIYEGDILATVGAEEYFIDGIVKWMDDRGAYYLVGPDGYATDSDYCYEGDEWSKLEVIGNIYESPELLEAK
jgi:uncharacterized phage protein (TIGR01671 family)